MHATSGDEGAPDSANGKAEAPVDSTRYLKLAASKVGKHMSEDTRAKISAVQRRRQQERRSLAVPAGDNTATVLWPKRKGPTAGAAASPAAGATSPPRAQQSVGKVAGGRRGQEVNVAQFKDDLRRFRLVREEVEAWSDGFKIEHQRRPTMSDIRRSQIPWLIEKFEEYSMLRRNLLTNAPNLRGALGTGGMPGGDDVDDLDTRRL